MRKMNKAEQNLSFSFAHKFVENAKDFKVPSRTYENLLANFIYLRKSVIIFMILPGIQWSQRTEPPEVILLSTLVSNSNLLRK